MRILAILLILSSLAFPQEVILDIPAQSFPMTAGDTATPFNIKGSLKKKPVTPVPTIVGSIAQGATLSGNVTWTATIQNVSPPVTFTIDGIQPWIEATAPYEYGGTAPGLNTNVLLNGQHIFRVTAGTASHQVTATVSNTVTPPPSNVLNLASYANGKDLVDDTVQIRAAISACAAQGKVLGVPEYSSFRYNSMIEFGSVSVIGLGPNAEFFATNFLSQGLVWRGANVKVQNIIRRCDVVGKDWQESFTHEHCGIVLMQTTNALVENCKVLGTGKVGILNYRSAGSRIIGNYVTTSRKDGIHNENGCVGAEIAFNEVTDTGDDMISVVSYNRTGFAMNRDIYIHDNYLHDQYYARGLTVVGGENIRIIKNRIVNSKVSGLYIWSENSYQTMRVDNILCEDNYIEGANTDTVSNWSALSVGGRSGFPCSNVTFRRTTIVNPRRDAVDVYPFVNNIRFEQTQISGVKPGFKTWDIDPSIANQVIIVP